MKIRSIITAYGLMITITVAPTLLAEQGVQTDQDQGAAATASGMGATENDVSADAGSRDSENGISVGELKQKVLVDEAGNKIANVSNIARGKQDDRLQAVVEVAGYYGMSRQEVMIPLSKLEIKNGQFVAPKTVASEKALKTGPQYDTAQHEVLSGEQMVQRSAFAAFEPIGTTDATDARGSTEDGQRGSADY